MITTQRWWLTTDGQTAVPDGDPRAAALLIGVGATLDAATAARYGIVDPALAPEPEADPAPEVVPEGEPEPAPDSEPEPDTKALDGPPADKAIRGPKATK